MPSKNKKSDPKGDTSLKKILSLFLAVAMMASLVLPLSSCSSGPSIVVCNWGEYMSTGSDADYDIIKEFEKATGIEVKYVTAESNETLYSQMKSGAGKYDVIFPSDYMVERMIAEDMLAKLNFDNIPNYKNIMDRFKGLDYDPNEEYSVPYFWGTVGIIYNESKLTAEDLAMMEDCKDWSILWSKNYPDQIMMMDNPRDAFGIALKQLGYSQNTVNEEEIRAAAALLDQQKFVYAMDQFFDMMPAGDLAVGTYYAGDCLTVMEENEDLRFVIPACGTNLFNDAMCIPKTSEKQALAEQFINFVLSAEAGKANTEYVCYSTPNAAAFELLDEEMQNDPIAYPEKKETWESFRNLPTATNDLVRELWNTVKTNNK